LYAILGGIALRTLWVVLGWRFFRIVHVKDIDVNRNRLSANENTENLETTVQFTLQSIRSVCTQGTIETTQLSCVCGVMRLSWRHKGRPGRRLRDDSCTNRKRQESKRNERVLFYSLILAANRRLGL